MKRNLKNTKTDDFKINVFGSSQKIRMGSSHHRILQWSISGSARYVPQLQISIVGRIYGKDRF